MKIRVQGAGWYGCHLSTVLLERGHDVEIHELGPHVFCGASGNIPARLHIGAHYPRSRKTREVCQRHHAEFLERYGFLTSAVPVNIYAIAEHHSLIDFGQYIETMKAEIPFIPIRDPAEFGLRKVEGAILVDERHILAREARAYFERELAGQLRLNSDGGDFQHFDLTIDCTFAAQSKAGVDRYEPCLVLQLRGPTDRAITIMDGPFPSLYPWSPSDGLCSLSSAYWGPFSKDIKTYGEARALLDGLTDGALSFQAMGMLDSMREFYPAIDHYELVDMMLSIRAMPLSGSDTRLARIERVNDGLIRVRAGKIDAVLEAEREVLALIGE